MTCYDLAMSIPENTSFSRSFSASDTAIASGGRRLLPSCKVTTPWCTIKATVACNNCRALKRKVANLSWLSSPQANLTATSAAEIGHNVAIVVLKTGCVSTPKLEDQSCLMSGAWCNSSASWTKRSHYCTHLLLHVTEKLPLHGLWKLESMGFSITMLHLSSICSL